MVPKAPPIPASVDASSTVDASSLRAAEHRLARIKARADRLEADLEGSRCQTLALEGELDKLREQHDSLRGLMTVRAERIRELELLLSARDQSLIEAQAALDTAQQQTKLERARADAAEVTTTSDDLQQLYGVGPKVEKRLHELGIRRYADIAGWTEDDIDRLAPQLKVHAKRIRRDGWVESARELVGEEADHELLEW